MSHCNVGHGESMCHNLLHVHTGTEVYGKVLINTNKVASGQTFTYPFMINVLFHLYFGKFLSVWAERMVGSCVLKFQAKLHCLIRPEFRQLYASKKHRRKA